MESHTRLPVITDDALQKFTDSGSLDRGRRYFKNGRVKEVLWNGYQLMGQVRGTRPTPYSVVVEFQGSSPYMSTCDCPVFIACKHAAAVLYAAKHAREMAPVVASDWRKSLAGFIKPKPTDGNALGIQFEVATPRNPFGRNGGRSTPRTDIVAVHEASYLDLFIRLMRRGKSGNWVRGSLTWQSMFNGTTALNYHPDHAFIAGQIYNLNLDSVYSYATDNKQIHVNNFTTGYIWSLLQQAARAGMEYVPGNQFSAVRIGAPAKLELHAREDGGGVGIEAVLSTSDYDGTDLKLLGSAGAAHIDKKGNESQLVLHPATAPFSSAAVQLYRSGGTVVDEEYKEEFVFNVLPRVRESINVVSHGDALVVRNDRTAELRVEVTFKRSHTTELKWYWHYTNPSKDYPFTPSTPAPTGARRDRDLETNVTKRVQGYWDRLGKAGKNTLIPSETAWFSTRVLPQLEDDPNINVIYIGEVIEYEELPGSPHVEMRSQPNDDNDWFDLHFVVTINGRDIPFVDVFKALAQRHDFLVLDDNTFVSLQDPKFDALREELMVSDLLKDWDKTDKNPRVSRYDYDALDRLSGLVDDATLDSMWVEALNTLKNYGDVKVSASDVPDSVHADLRDYQLHGYAWMRALYEARLGGILADDMGLGKTLQVLTLIAWVAEQWKERGKGGSALKGQPFLVVAPASVVNVWKREAHKFTPDLSVITLTSTSKRRKESVAEAVAGCDIAITSYAVARLDGEEFAEYSWAGLIMDEAQFIKNPASQTHKALQKIPAKFALAVTGTPMENSLQDMWSLLNIVAPSMYPRLKAFKEQVISPVEIGRKMASRLDSGGNSERELTELEVRGANAMAGFQRRVRPFMLRRTKESVSPELPEKQEFIHEVELNKEHLDLYRVMLQKERKKLVRVADSDKPFVILKSLTLLRLLALDPSLVDEDYAHVKSSKLAVAMDMIEEVAAEGHRILVFSQFTSFLKKVAGKLKDASIAHEYLDGATANRGAVIDKFKTGDAPVFLISLKSGGFGLTLTEADYVFLLDPWWNPAAENQAIDRTHRIGQDKNVMVYRLVSQGTIEEHVLNLQQRKADLFNNLTGEATFASTFTSEDINDLLNH